MNKLITLIAGLCTTLHLNSGTDLKLPQQPNVIIIISDDLNDRVGFLSENPQALTPNMDRLAKESLNFTDAHVPATVCNPSRTSILTSKLPSNTGLYRIEPFDAPHYLVEKEGLTTIMQSFKEAGYISLGTGKIFHRGDNKPKYFDEYYDTSIRYESPSNRVVIDYHHFEGDESNFSDIKKTAWAIDKLKQEHDKPFLLIVGYEAPHLPWVVPKRYFDLYDPKTITVPAVDDNSKIAQMDRYVEPFIRDKNYEKWQEVIAAYFASVSFMDDQVGKIMETVNSGHYKDNTIVIVTSDHGFHLGEKKATQKYTLWKESTHVPFLLRIPGITDEGKVCNRTVGLIDLYPTLIDLCNLKAVDNLDGRSLTPLIQDPERDWQYPVITSQIYKSHSVRTEEWCYIKYDSREELYDRKKDSHENNNLAEDKHYAKVLNKMRKLLPKTNREPIVLH